MRRVRVSSSVPSRATSCAALRARCAPRRATSTIPLDLVIPKPAPAGGYVLSPAAHESSRRLALQWDTDLMPLARPRVIQPNASSAQRAPAISEEEFAKAMEPLRVISGQTLGARPSTSLTVSSTRDYPRLLMRVAPCSYRRVWWARQHGAHSVAEPLGDRLAREARRHHHRPPLPRRERR